MNRFRTVRLSPAPMAVAALLSAALFPSYGGAQTLLKDIHPGPAGSLSFGLTESAVMNGVLYFSASSPAEGTELWRTDGTTAGTRMVADTNPGPNGIAPKTMTVLGSTLLFAGTDAAHGEELWRSDGTAAGTRLVMDINPGSGGSRIGPACVFGGDIYFSASDSTNGPARIWRSDGYAARSVNPGGDLLAGSGSGFPVLFGGAVYFVGSDRSGAYSNELCRTDGTAPGTGLFRAINRSNPLGSMPHDAVVAGGWLYFVALDAVQGWSVWRTDGTTANTTLVIGGGGPARLHAVGSRVFFVRTDATSGEELWVTDGTAAGTQLVKDLEQGVVSSSPRDLCSVGTTLFFIAWTSWAGTELFRSDGTPAGTRVVKPRGRSTSTGEPVKPGTLSALSGTGLAAISSGYTGSFGEEPFLTDGTPEGTGLAGDVFPGPVGSMPRTFVRVGSYVVFAAIDYTSGQEPWSIRLHTPVGATVGAIGSGCPGTGALIPRIGTQREHDWPHLGNARFGLLLNDGLPFATGLWLLGSNRVHVGIGGTCTLFVGTPLTAILGYVDSSGQDSLPIAVPIDPALVGGVLLAQYFILDPKGAALGIGTLSNGLELRIGL